MVVGIVLLIIYVVSCVIKNEAQHLHFRYFWHMVLWGVFTGMNQEELETFTEWWDDIPIDYPFRFLRYPIFVTLVSLPIGSWRTLLLQTRIQAWESVRDWQAEAKGMTHENLCEVIDLNKRRLVKNDKDR